MVVAARNATFLFDRDELRETAWCSHLHAQVRDGAVIKISADPVQEGEIISVDERKADAAARRCSDGAAVLFQERKEATLK